MKLKYTALNDSLYQYLCQQRSDASDLVLHALRAETAARTGEDSKMQISPDQGTFLMLLARMAGARAALEIGTFTGYSSICLARGLAQDGKLVCLDASEEWTAVARRFWAEAGLHDKIELRLGPAIPTLEKMTFAEPLDLVFIDADKTEYESYYELVLPNVKQNGVILFDNMLRGGRLGGDAPLESDADRAVDVLNKKLAKDTRIECVLLPIADGIQFCRKR